MKWILPILVVVFCVVPSLVGAEAIDAAWLKKACVAAGILETRQKDAYTHELHEHFLTGMFYYRGIIMGINTTFLSSEKSMPAMRYPPNEFSQFRLQAASILAFIQKHEGKMHKGILAEDIIIAWYLTNHPDSSQMDKYQAAEMLEKNYRTSGRDQ